MGGCSAVVADGDKLTHVWNLDAVAPLLHNVAHLAKAKSTCKRDSQCVCHWLLPGGRAAMVTSR